MRAFIRFGQVLACAAVLLLAFPLKAAATAIDYTLALHGAGITASGPYGDVLIDDGGGTGTVTVTVTLLGNERFAGTGAGDALAFNIFNEPAIGIAINGANAADFQVNTVCSGNLFGCHEDGAGDFMYAVTCTQCQGGQAGNDPGPLKLTITFTGITVNSFIANANGNFFASDIAILIPGADTQTGVVWANGGDAREVPEPTTLALLGTGFVGLAAALRRRFAR